MTHVSADKFRVEVDAWARRIGVAPSEVHIRTMKRKWGSCSTSGRLTFSKDLLEQSVEERSRVIVHELLHLKVPNHGPLFRQLEAAYLGANADGAAPKRNPTVDHFAPNR